MTLTTESSWTGGALGVNPTLTTEPTFSAQGGIATNAVYSAAIGGESGQAVRVTGVRYFTRAVSGNHWRRAFRVSRVAGTQTAGHAVLILRSGAKNVADVFIRNQNGGQYALRAGAGGTTYMGQSTTATANGEAPWRIEVEYESTGGVHTVRLYLFNPGNNSTSPNDTFTGTTTLPVDDFHILNPTGTTGLTLDVGSVLYEDTGAPIWAGASAPGTLTFLSNIWGSQSSLRVSGKVADATNVTFAVGGNTTTVTPDAAGYFKATLTGLTAGTSHSWEVLVDGVSRRTGSSRTLPSTLNGHRILWGSCFDTYTSGFFANAAARDPDLIAMVGDWSYPYLNGVIASTDLATVRAVKETVLAAAGPQGLFSKFITSYTYSDTDGAGANSDGTWQGFTSGAVQGAYRQQWAHPDLPLADTGARSWVIDKVRFIQTDELTMAADRSATDNSSKSKLGTAQKAWFKAQIDAAKDAHQSVVWFGDGPWLGAASTGGTNNQWTAYSTERTEPGAYIAASGVKLIRLHGDTHTLFCDDGTNNQWGGFPTASAAPFHTTANPYGGTVTGGKWPTAQTNSSRQYGIAEFSESLGVLTLNLRGYSSTNSEPTEVERFNMPVDMTPAAVVTYPSFVEVVAGVEKPLQLIEVVGGVEKPMTVEIVS